ncbi:MAG: ABC transporter ATP-binding protein [Chloroflexota bacterium]|nr:MAG: ABC transporter ATP-binding protein [Chloroflexota bacterium]
MLTVNNLEVKYLGVILVLKGVWLEVPDGHVVALLGANGAGKTTTLKALSGLLRTEEGEVTKGSIEFDNVRIERKGPQDIVKMGIVQVLEGRRLFRYLTVEENLRIGGSIGRGGRSREEDIDLVFHYFPRLKDLRRRTSGYLSGGEQQMVAIGRALMAHPKLMLLDEPSLGLSPSLTDEIFEIIKTINRERGTSFLLVEQNTLGALAIANYGYVLQNGKIVLDGTAAQLRENEDIKEFYLGVGEAGVTKSFHDVKHYRRRKRWLD